MGDNSIPPPTAWLTTLIIYVTYVVVALGISSGISRLHNVLFPEGTSNVRKQVAFVIGRAFLGQSIALTCSLNPGCGLG